MVGRVIVVAGAMLLSASAQAWGGVGHKAVTYMALDLMERALGESADTPDWLFTDAMLDRAAYQSSEVDRVRAVRDDVMSHENNPEHYLDIELLNRYDLTLRTMPRLRREFIERIVLAHHEHPERFEDYDAERDRAMVYYFPGFGAHAAMESYYRLVGAFRNVRILERISGDDEMRLRELGQARANVINHMGNLSHWIGDLAQPLHTTIHHHGWVGENPEGYTTEYAFHNYIDSGILMHHGIGELTLRDTIDTHASQINHEDPWEDVLDHLERAFGELETLYRMHRDGTLEQDVGRWLIVGRLADGGRTLGGMYLAAWRASEITDEDVETYLRFEPESLTAP
ncbi:MAG: hypothetical protein ACF8GE_10755 [Phycisphaerales bacterium JB043]